MDEWMNKYDDWLEELATEALKGNVSKGDILQKLRLAYEQGYEYGHEDGYDRACEDAKIPW